MKSNRRKLSKNLVLLLIIAVTFFIGGKYLWKTRFNNHTYINGLDCSFQTVQSVANNLEKQLHTDLSFLVITKDSTTHKYTPTSEVAESFEIKISDLAILQNLLDTQKKNTKERTFQVSQLFNINESSLRKYLESIPELSSSSSGGVTIPQNAYLAISENNTLEIVDEVYGNLIDFEEAYSIAITKLKDGIGQIDFSPITKTDPDILSTDENLIKNQLEINSLLETTISYQLANKDIITLDSSTTINWLNLNDDGTFSMDLSGNLTHFIDMLAEKVDVANSSIAFNATDIGEVHLEVRDAVRARLDKEAELVRLKECFENSGSYTFKPFYTKTPISDLLNCYVELDITRQTVWMYKDGECILESLCVTGNVAHGTITPTGIYFLTYKMQDAVLRGFNRDGSTYASPVKYWMPFNGGIGFHDASWRYQFGGEIYKKSGSHGCVNMPTKAAATLYQNIDESIPIIVYTS